MSRAASEKYLTRMEQYFDEKAGIPSHNDGPWCYLYLDFIADWLAEGVEGADRYGQSADAKMIQTNCMYIVSLDRLSKRLEVLGDRESAVPPNTTATLFLPTQKPDAVTEAGCPLAGARGVKLLGVGEGTVSVALDSGAYAFAW